MCSPISESVDRGTHHPRECWSDGARRSCSSTRFSRRKVAVLPDQVPVPQRGLVSGVLGVCLPVASISGTYVVQLFSGQNLAMFLAP